jgi:hypothetical protein
MRTLLLSIVALSSPFAASAQSFAYERDIPVTLIQQETSVWVDLDLHAQSADHATFLIVDASGNPVPFKEHVFASNLIGSADVIASPRAAATVPPTDVSMLKDGDVSTAFQPVAARDHVFRFRFSQEETPTALSFSLKSGWIDGIRVRLGDGSTMKDAFVGSPGGTRVALSGERASVVEVSIRAGEGILSIAEMELHAPTSRLLFRAKPGERYKLLYGTKDIVKRPPSGGVFADDGAISVAIGGLREIASGGPDADRDGVPDAIDVCPKEADPRQEDGDRDGIGDACDNAPHVANAAQGDQDKDGIGDARDNCPDLPNVDQRETDFDGVGWACEDDDYDGVENGVDNCVGVANADQRDLNNNKIGDACQNDIDRDGVPRDLDNCTTTLNPDQSDGDEDGIGDACDVCPEHVDPQQIDRDKNGIGDVCQRAMELKARDVDGDGVPDEGDLCRAVPNPKQEDADGDKVGDACDNCPAHNNPGQYDGDRDGKGDDCTDTDSDGLLDPEDNCPAYANADQKDADRDGHGDPCDDADADGFENARDNCPYDFNPAQSDEDRDDLGNACDTSDDRWSEDHPWLLWASMGGAVLLLVGLGALVLSKAPPEDPKGLN